MIFRFYQNSANSTIMDLFYANSDQPQRVHGGLHICAKFGCDRCSIFDNMQVLIFCAYCLENAHSRSKLEGFGVNIPPVWCVVSM